MLHVRIALTLGVGVVLLFVPYVLVKIAGGVLVALALIHIGRFIWSEYRYAKGND